MLWKFVKTVILPLAVAGESFAQVVSSKPNVLIIMTDEHNLRTLGCYREQMPREQAEIWGKGNVVETPNIDELARNGLISLNCYASSPISGPTRACFQTGLYSHRAGMPTNDLCLSEEVETFADVLGNNGYHTIYVGKWHLDGDAWPGWRPERKCGWQDNKYMYNRGHWKKMVQTLEGADVGARNAKGNVCYALDGADEKSFTTDFLCDRAIEQIKAREEGKPFCCMISIPDPHGPNTVRAPYDKMFETMDFTPPYTYMYRGDHLNAGWEAHQGKFNVAAMRNYYGMVKCIDDNVGKLILFLRSEGLWNNTIVIFTADHGDLCGEHHRYNKSVPYDMSARVPFIMTYPRVIKPGMINKTVWASVDFKSSLLGLLDLKSERKNDGTDVSAYWKGKNRSKNIDLIFMRSPTRDEVFMQKDKLEKSSYWVAAVTSRYKLVYTPNSQEVPWLIDRKKDPFELKNFYNSKNYEKIVKRLSRELLEYGRRSNDPIIMRTSVKEQLKSQFKD